MTDDLQNVDALRENLKGEIRRLEQMIASERELRILLSQEQERALDKAEQSLSRRLDTMNEIREQLGVQAATFLPRETFEETRNSWEVWRAGVDQTLALMQGRGLGIQTLSDVVLKVIPVMIAIVSTVVAIYLAVNR